MCVGGRFITCVCFDASALMSLLFLFLVDEVVCIDVLIQQLFEMFRYYTKYYSALGRS